MESPNDEATTTTTADATAADQTIDFAEPMDISMCNGGGGVNTTQTIETNNNEHEMAEEPCTPLKQISSSKLNIINHNNRDDLHLNLLTNNNNNNNNDTNQIEPSSPFNSIFSNEADFQSFLEVLEKKETDCKKSPKFYEFARQSLCLLFDPVFQKNSNTLSPDKVKRISFLRDKQEAIKCYLSEIKEEDCSFTTTTTTALNTSNSNSNTNGGLSPTTTTLPSQLTTTTTTTNQQQQQLSNSVSLKTPKQEALAILEKINKTIQSRHASISEQPSIDIIEKNQNLLADLSLDDNIKPTATTTNNESLTNSQQPQDDSVLSQPEKPKEVVKKPPPIKKQPTQTQQDKPTPPPTTTTAQNDSSLTNTPMNDSTGSSQIIKFDYTPELVANNSTNEQSDNNILQLNDTPFTKSPVSTKTFTKAEAKQHATLLQQQRSAAAAASSSSSSSSADSHNLLTNGDLNGACSVSSDSQSSLVDEISLLKENEKRNLETIRYLQDENNKFIKIAVEFESILQNLIKDKEETESKLKAEIIELTKERNHLQEDVVGVETAFNDLHRRFEKLKTKVEEFKKNEEQLQKSNEVLQQQIEKEKQKYSTLKKHAEEKLELANNEIDKLRKNTAAEIQALKAELRKSEIKISSLELTVQQKDTENTQLTNLLEDLLQKVKNQPTQ